MSHFMVCVFTTGKGDNQSVNEVLAPFGTGANYRFDWWQIGGRWSGAFGGYDTIPVKYMRIPNLDNMSEQELKEQSPQAWEEYQNMLNGKSYLAPFVVKGMYPTFKDFLWEEHIAAPECFVDEAGEWQDKGGPGFRKQFWQTLEKLQSADKEYWVTVVDCHL